MKPMKWRASKIPRKESGKGTFWEQKISPELERAMKLNPGQTFQLLDDNGEPAELLFLDSETLRSSCQRPFRLQARRVKGLGASVIILAGFLGVLALTQLVAYVRHQARARHQPKPTTAKEQNR